MMHRLLTLTASVAFSLFSACSHSPNAMAKHFNDSAADESSQADRVIETLAIQAGDSVADIGAGGGHFTYKLARAVGPQGTVFAVDIEQAYLDLIEHEIDRQRLRNVRLVLGSMEQSNLPLHRFHLVFVRNTFHDISDRVTYFANLKNKMLPNGRVAIIDYEPSGLVSRLHGHVISEEEIVEEMEEAGFAREERHEFLSSQSFNIFAMRASETQR